jgi:hypothetical protein
MKIRPVGARVVPCGQTERHVDAITNEESQNENKLFT